MGGSLFPADNSGIAGVMFGLVGLVLFGTTLILVIDGQLQTGEEISGPADTGGEADAEIAGLVKQTELLRKTLGQRESWQAGIIRLDQAKQELARLEEDARRLKEQVARERVTTGELEESFAAYRIDHRRRLWADAVGHQMDELRLPVGKVYKDVTIRSVSAVELKISHTSGSATIPIRSLPPDIVKTYHLNHGEAQRLEDDRNRNDAAPEVEPREPTGRPAPRSRRDIPPARPGKDPRDDGRIAALKTEAAKLRSQILSLSTQIADARQQALYGKRRSPPGSLETWSQRVTRLTKVQGQASGRLTVVEGDLRRLDPYYRPPMR